MKKYIINEEKRHLSVHVGYAVWAASDGGGQLGRRMKTEAGEELVPDICGDTAFSCRLPDGSRAVILSDGMGHGYAAAAESRAAAGLLRRLLKQGRPIAGAIKEVNRYLLERSMRNGEKESYATVDLAVIDQVSGRAKFYKMGAAPSYLVRGRRIRRIQQPALPMGILPGIRLTHVSAKLAPGDIIVMMSDGISDSGWRRTCEGCQEYFREEDWIKSFLSDVIKNTSDKGKKAGPRQLARRLLEEAGHRYGNSEQDDATAVVIVIG